MGDARVEIIGDSLSAHADDDTVGFGIPGDQFGLVAVFLNGHYFRCFGHDTEYADCSARTPVAKASLLARDFHDHHEIKQPVSSPAAQPTNLPLAETGTQLISVFWTEPQI